MLFSRFFIVATESSPNVKNTTKVINSTTRLTLIPTTELTALTSTSSVVPSENSQDSEWPEFDIVDEQNLALNNSSTIEESHKYFNSTIEQNNNLTSLHWQGIKGRCFNHTTHKRLSNSSLSAATVKLPFIFYFYGHPISSVLVTTDGFLYTGDKTREHIAMSQYISPLMAHFDTSLSRDSYVQHCSDGESNWIIFNLWHVNCFIIFRKLLSCFLGECSTDEPIGGWTFLVQRFFVSKRRNCVWLRTNSNKH